MFNYIPEVGISQQAFAEYERNRMYPPNYGKESFMKKPKMRHINAVTRAQNLLETSIDVTDNPKLAASIIKDISLLCEVRDILFYMFENPALPFKLVEITRADPILNQIEAEPDESF